MSGFFRGHLLYFAIAVIVPLIMIGAYASVGLAFNSTSKELWSTNPLPIVFSGAGGAGSSGRAVDSFKCAPPVENINLKTTTSDPARISLTLSQYSFVSCGPPFRTITLTAQCLVSTCNGNYTGTVLIFRDQYDLVPTGLVVNIQVV